MSAENEKKAWRKYLRATQNLTQFSNPRYEEMEPWAWAKLQEELLSIHRQREKSAA